MNTTFEKISIPNLQQAIDVLIAELYSQEIVQTFYNINIPHIPADAIEVRLLIEHRWEKSSYPKILCQLVVTNESLHLLLNENSQAIWTPLLHEYGWSTNFDKTLRLILKQLERIIHLHLKQTR